MEEFTPKNTAKINNMPTLPYAIEEAVNRLRVNISFLGSEVKKIMVISSMPDEGKSFVSMQLWRQMAEANVRSILLDMDLRKSVTVDKYQIEQEKGKILGMSFYLANDASLEECVLRTDIGRGDILPNVDNVVNPSMLLEGHKFERTLKELENYYRYIFIDSPPLNLVSDGEKIGSLCDGAILVVRAGSIRQLERANCPLIGIVLSRAQAGNGGYYSKKYGGYYSKKYGGYYGKKYYGSKYYGSKSNYYYGYGVQK